jgi:hypothetical protein
MKRWQIERWRTWELRACRLVGMEQVGGPGRVDCRDRTRRRVAEVKVGVITKGVIPRTLRGGGGAGRRRGAERSRSGNSASPSRHRAPADLREALVGPLQRVEVLGPVEVERLIGELHNPAA